MLPATQHPTPRPPPQHARRRTARPLSVTVLSILLGLTLGHSLSLRAEPLAFPTLTTTQGVTYTDVKVTRFDALELRFSHTNGIATVPLAQLPPDLQTLFGYDPKNEIQVLRDKQSQRAQAIITEADQKAKAAALRQQQEADAQELQRIRRKPLRCYISSVQRTEDALLIAVQPVERLPVKIRSRSGRSERIKLNPQGKPQLLEKPVPGQTFVLGPTLRILPATAPLAAGKIITVYLITTKAGPDPLCAPSPEAALEYRKKLAASQAPGTTPPPSTATPPGSAPPPQGSANP